MMEQKYQKDQKIWFFLPWHLGAIKGELTGKTHWDDEISQWVYCVEPMTDDIHTNMVFIESVHESWIGTTEEEACQKAIAYWNNEIDRINVQIESYKLRLGLLQNNYGSSDK